MNVYMEKNLKEPMDKLLELVNEVSKITSESHSVMSDSL